MRNPSKSPVATIFKVKGDSMLDHIFISVSDTARSALPPASITTAKTARRGIPTSTVSGRRVGYFSGCGKAKRRAMRHMSDLSPTIKWKWTKPTPPLFGRELKIMARRAHGFITIPAITPPELSTRTATRCSLCIKAGNTGHKAPFASRTKSINACKGLGIRRRSL